MNVSRRRMSRRILTALLALAVGACALRDLGDSYHSGPASDHFDGARFHNPEGPIGKSLLDVLHWRLFYDRAEWPESVPLAASATPAARVHGGELAVTFVGHATALVQTAGLNVLTDPTWAERAFLVSWAGPKRVTPPGIAFEDLPPIDVVLVSHNHYDHMDLPTLARLQRAHDPLFVVPLGNARTLHAEEPAMRVVELDWWDSVATGADVRVHAVPVYHWSRRRLFDRNKALWSGFVIEAPRGHVYFGGDTGLGSGAYFRQAAERFGGFRLALLPVGSYEPRWFMKDQHLDPAEAVQVHRLLRAEASLGIHLRTFQLTDEGYGQPDIDLAQALREQAVPPERFRTLPAGGRWDAGSALAAGPGESAYSTATARSERLHE